MASYQTSYLPDDEEEARQAEIDRIVSSFGTELAAGMEAGRLPEGAGERPLPADPLEGARPSANMEVVDPWANEPPRPAAPTPAPAPAAAPTPRTVQQAPGGAQQAQPVPRGPTPAAGGANMARGAAGPVAALPLPPGPGPDQSRQYQSQIDALDNQQRREQRRRGIAAAFLAPFMGGREGVERFVTQHAGDYADRRDSLRGLLAQHQEQRASRERARGDAMRALVESRQRQANADRDFALRERGIASLEGHRTAQSEIGRGRLGLQQHTQEWREEQAQIERDAKEVRARIIAGQRVGRGGTPMPGGAPGTEPGGPDVDDYLDAPVIRGFLSIRPEYMETARQLAAETRAAGGEANEQEIAWELASRGFSRLPRDEQDRIRRSFMSPEGSTGAANAPRRDEDQLTTRVRQYGQDVSGSQDWAATVRRANASLANASDEDIMLANQWLAGGAARQGIARAMAPRAEQLGRAVSALRNQLLRERSGAAVTEAEFARLNSELGTDWYSSPSALREALSEMQASVRRIESNLAGTYGPDVIDAYRANQRAAGGRSSTDGGQVRAGDTVTIGGQQIVLTPAQADAYNRARGGQR